MKGRFCYGNAYDSTGTFTNGHFLQRERFVLVILQDRNVLMAKVFRDRDVLWMEYFVTGTFSDRATVFCYRNV